MTHNILTWSFGGPELENWHPVLLVFVISLIPTMGGLIVLFLLTYRLPPIIFFPVVAVVAMALHSYVYMTYRYFKQGKLKRAVALALALTLTFVTPYAVYAVVTPNWNFKIFTDKMSYRSGDRVAITARLSNNGYLARSISTNDSVRLVFEIEDYHLFFRDYLSYNLGQSELSILPSRSFEKTLVWNQTRLMLINHYETRILMNETGDYIIHGELYDSTDPSKELFGDSVLITIEP